MQTLLSVRPYQLMCIVCKIGAGLDADLGDERLNEISRKVRENPEAPITLRCNVDSVYRYQNPGTEEDTPEGELFNVKRDMDIVQKMGLVPGATRPAKDMFQRLFDSISTTKGVCGYGQVTSETWKGCADAKSGNYEKGHAQGLNTVIPPRSEEEKAEAKKQSTTEMYKSDRLFIRPHHLMCMTCFHGGKEEITPIQEDNLFEAIDIIQKNPDIPVTLIAGCCMICPPCTGYDPRTKLCVGGISMGMRDQKKDLDVLQRLGLKFGDTFPARKIYRLLFEKIHSTRQICGYDDGIVRAPEWRICGGPEGSPSYERGRQAGLGIFK